MKTLILYFSGTGNTKYLSEKISLKMKELNFQTEIHSIEEDFKIEKNTFDALILGCPKYYEYPVLDFINYLEKNLPVNEKNIPVMFFCTQAGPLHTYFRKIESFLKRRNYSLIIGKSFAVANNYFLFKFFPCTPEEKIKSNLAAFDKELKPLLEDFISGRANKEKPNIFMGITCYLTAVICTKLFKVFGVKYSASPDCTSCELCSKKCPKNNIILVDNKPKFGRKCIFCMRCMNMCPHQAILYNKKHYEKFEQIKDINK